MHQFLLILFYHCVLSIILLLSVELFNNSYQDFGIEHFNDLYVKKYFLNISTSTSFDKHNIWPKLSQMSAIQINPSLYNLLQKRDLILFCINLLFHSGCG